MELGCVLGCHGGRKWLGSFKMDSLELLLNWLNSCRHSRKLNFFRNTSDYHHTTLADLSAVLRRATAAAILNLTRCLFLGTSVPVTHANWNQNRGSAINNITECLRSQTEKDTRALYSVQILKFHYLSVSGIQEYGISPALKNHLKIISLHSKHNEL